MREIDIVTRTLPPTDTEPKRVRVRTTDGYSADYLWDHGYDGPEVHKNAARQAATLGKPDATVTALHRIHEDSLGYTFRATVEGVN